MSIFNIIQNKLTGQLNSYCPLCNKKMFYDSWDDEYNCGEHNILDNLILYSTYDGCTNTYRVFARNSENFMILDLSLNDKKVMVKINNEQCFINQGKFQNIQDIISFFKGAFVLS